MFDVDGFANDKFGSSVSMAGEFLVVGAPSPTVPGSTYVYRIDSDGSDFVLLSKIGCPTPADGDQYGHSVAVTSAGLLVVGAVFLSMGSPNTGATIVYTIAETGDLTFESFLPAGMFVLGYVVFQEYVERWIEGLDSFQVG